MVGPGPDARGLTAPPSGASSAPPAALVPGAVYHAAVTGHPDEARTRPDRLAAAATAVAAAIVVVAVAVVPFLTPAWVGFEQGRGGAAALTGFSEAELRTATDAILHDLVLGPPDFAVEVGGAPILVERERSHMRDVRAVFGAFAGLAVAAAVALTALFVRARRHDRTAQAWSAVRSGMRWLIAGIVVAGVVATFFFDVAFEIFHRLFFTGGSYTFDPRTDRLVQLFPFQFWSETTIVLGGLIVVLAVITFVVASRRIRSRAAAIDSSAAAPVVARPETAR